MDGTERRRLRRRLLGWYSLSGRGLPWRRTRDPYAILVSEVMLQQTQVARVVPVYLSFLALFPTLRTLARASLGDVLRAWSGLGYNRRAQHLHRIARLSTRGLPRDAEALDALPGIGAYTAGAVACFAHGARGAFADTNVRRTLGRIVLGRIATEAEAVTIDQALMPRDARTWHHALMDLGATVCVARLPRCDACPVRAICRSQGAIAPPAKAGQTPFATSDRRVRGQIISLLRQRDMSAASLRAELQDERVDRLLEILVEEELVQRRGANVGLPA